MGVNLSGLTSPRTVDLADLGGKRIAIDAYNTIYQFLAIIRQPNGLPLCDNKGRITSHLSGILYRTANLIGSGIEPSFVFDGKPHEMKKMTLDKRRDRRDQATTEWEEALEEGDMKKAFSKAQQTSRMTPDIRQSAKSLIRYLGLPTVDALGDGEAQAAYMCRKGDVWAAASQDFDSILFGAPVLVRNMTITGRRKIPGKDLYKDVMTEVIDSAEFLDSLDITREQLVDMCILMGTDFNEGINGIGPKKGLKLIREHCDLEHALPAIGKEITGYQDVRDIFLDSQYTDDYDIRPSKVDRQAVVDLMKDFDFSPERVEGTLDKIEDSRRAAASRKKQRSLDSWF